MSVTQPLPPLPAVAAEPPPVASAAVDSLVFVGGGGGGASTTAEAFASSSKMLRPPIFWEAAAAAAPKSIIVVVRLGHCFERWRGQERKKERGGGRDELLERRSARYITWLVWQKDKKTDGESKVVLVGLTKNSCWGRGATADRIRQERHVSEAGNAWNAYRVETGWQQT